MLRLIVVFAVVALCNSHEIDDDTVTKIHNWNLCTECHGEEFAMSWAQMQMAAIEKCGGSTHGSAAAKVLPAPVNAFLKTPLYTTYQAQPYTYTWNPYGMNRYGRKKREIEVTQEAINNLHDVWSSKLGNIECVLKEIGVLDAAGEIDTAFFTPRAIQNRYGSSKAGSDPVFLQKLAGQMSDCYDISRSWPQSALNKNHFKQIYGRRMVFFHCCMKAERALCMKSQMAKHLEQLTGMVPTTSFTTDKYDAAAMAVQALKHSSTPEEKFADQFFWGDSKM